MTLPDNFAGLLDFLICPGFCVTDSVITQCNQAAAAMLLTVGTDIRPLLLTGKEEYAAFQGTCIYLKLTIGNRNWGAAVFRKDGKDYFFLDQPEQDDVLNALALAARELRQAMTGTMASADRLAQHLDGSDQEGREQLSRLHRGLHRTLRLIGNMSDANGWPHANRQSICSFGSVLSEILEKAQVLAQSTGITLTYHPHNEEVLTLLDREQFERAVLNLLSNALKFTSPGGTIQVSLTRSGRMLRFSILDSGSGIPDTILGTIFNRYLRQPGLEDSRYGLGLGMTLVRNAAAAHGGTVLIDQPEGGGTRITMTLAIRQTGTVSFRSPMLGLDYAGERDHALLELADVLPLEFYQK